MPKETHRITQMRLYAEDENNSTVVLMPRRHRNYSKRFKTMFEEAMITLGQFDRPASYYRVMLHLLATLDPVQYRKISMSEIMAEIHASASSVERALTMLERDRVIFTKGTTSAKARRLNNRICWASNSEKWNAAEADPEVIDARGR